MSTVPKLTYAKIGNKAKNKMEGDSNQFFVEDGGQQQDLFSHLNQDNLNYISKQLKTMRINVNREQVKREEEVRMQQTNNNTMDKLYNKYKGQQKISEKEPDLEETDRVSTQQKMKNFNFGEVGFDDFRQINENRQQMKTKLENVDKSNQVTKNIKIEYQPVLRVYSQDNKRKHSLDTYYGVAPSTNTDQNRVLPQFFNGLDQYLTDLTQSKSLKGKYVDEPPPIKTKQDVPKVTFPKSASRETSKEKRRPSEIELDLKESEIKLKNLKKSNTSFAERRSRQMVIEAQQSRHQPSILEQQMILAQQKRNTMQLTLELEKIRRFLLFKDNTIKNLEMNNELLREEVTHLNINKEIILQKQYPNKQKTAAYQAREQPLISQKPTKRVHNENEKAVLNNFGNTNLYFMAKKGIIDNPSKSIHSSRESSHKLRYDDLSGRPEQVFIKFGSSNGIKQNSRIGTPRMNSESLQKIQRQFEMFLKDDDDRVSSRKGSHKLRDAYY